jgi:hypothetical protein
VGGSFTAAVSTNGDGTKSVTSNSTGVCTVSGLAVSYVGVGTCSLTAHVAAGTNFAAADGTAQTFSVSQGTPTRPAISNLPTSGAVGGGFAATVSTTGDGTKSVTSNSTGVCTVSGLAVSYVGVGTCSLTAHVATGTNFAAANGVAQTFSVTAVPAPFAPLTPVRVCDSRAVSTFVPANQCNSGAGNPIGPITAGGTKTINVANAGDGGLGTFGVPADATSVVLNVTAVNPAAPGGFMTVYPAGASEPNASNLNYPTGETVPNLVQVGVGTGGDINFASSDQTDLIVDVEGYSAPPTEAAAVLKAATVTTTQAGLYTALSAPLRLCDTRAPNSFVPANQCDGPGSAAGTLAANGPKDITVTNGTSIPSGATAAVLNVTVVNPAAGGFLTAYPQGSTEPNASNLNFGAGQTTTNRVIVPLSASGKVTVVSSARTDAIVDVSGYFSAAGGTGAEFSPEAAPVRVCDTRAVTTFSPQNQCSNEHLASGTSHELTLKVTNGGSVSDGVPANATAVVVNLTGIGPSASTFLTVFPGPTLPNSSDLNPAAGETRANLVVATVNPSTGDISVFNNTGSLDVIVDVLGWYS